MLKKTIKVICIFLAIIIILILIISGLLFSKKYICEVKEGFDYKGQHYSEYDEYEKMDEDYPFIPFGSSHCNFIEELKFKKYFFLEYYSEDSERLFFYDFTPFGNYIFKKDGYSIPNNPEPESIDFIMVTYCSGNRFSYIYNKDDIKKLVSYFNEIHDKVSSDNIDADVDTEPIRIVAFSKKYGGMFDLTADHRSVCHLDENILFANKTENLSPDISSVLMTYYEISKLSYN